MKYGSWKISGYNRSAAVGLVKGGVNPLAAVVLASRGIDDPEVFRAMGSEDVSGLHDPFLLKDMGSAAERVRTALSKGEHMAVYGDYDVDGITGACLLAGYFRSKGVRCDIYIPDRLEEGYGVKKEGIRTLAGNGVSLIVTVDCGITAIEETEYARSLGLDMVITDHHECGDELPGTSVVNPRRRDCPYPDKNLAGVGVAFKLICAVEGPDRTEELLTRYGDLVAVGTVADVMPVTGENRIFIRQGIGLIKNGSRPGFDKLCQAVGMDKEQLTVTGISFIIAPRLTAAGRMSNTRCSTSLLLTRNPEIAERRANELCALNRRRKELEEEMFRDAMATLEKNPPGDDPVVLYSSKWHQGVAGIVASKVAERYRLPAIMICLKGGLGRGSCRSFGNFNLYDALESLSPMLEGFGGHEMAAGLTIKRGNIDGFKSGLAEYYHRVVTEPFEYVLDVDFEVIKPRLLTVENVMALDELEPYGVGNPRPTLCIKNAVIQNLTALAGGRHTKLTIRKWDEFYECVFFSHSIGELGIREGGTVDVAFIPQINEFRGKRSVQLLLEDLKVIR